MEPSTSTVTPAPSAADKIIRVPMLLQKIARHLPAKTLQHLRSTCIDWNLTFAPQFKKKHIPISIGLCSPSEGMLSKFREYTGAMVASKDIPFIRYKLHKHYSLCEVAPTEQQLMDFFSKCGPTITSLEFDLGEMERMSRFLCGWTPELADLTVVSNKVYYDRDRQIQFPSHLPKLKRLHFCCGRTGPDALRRVLEHVDQLQDLELSVCNRPPFPIREICVVEDLNLVHALKGLTGVHLQQPETKDLDGVLLLINLAHRRADGLALERFSLRLQRPATSQRDAHLILLDRLTTFLISQASSLRQLEIGFDPGFYAKGLPGDREVVRLPRMDTLNYLRVGESEGWDLSFEGETLGATFPALECFEYIGQDHVTMEELSRLRHEAVVDLRWKSGQNLNLTALRVWFPAVTRVDLKIGAPDLGKLEVLWNNWPTLQSVKISYMITRRRGVEQGLQLDELLSGVRRTELRRARRELAEIKMNPGGITKESLRGIRGKYKTLFGIGDQKHLQKFTLEINDLQALEFTNIGGYLGLAFAPRSLEFQIKLVAEAPASSPAQRVPWISAECLALVKEEVGPFSVIFM